MFLWFQQRCTGLPHSPNRFGPQNEPRVARVPDLVDLPDDREERNVGFRPFSGATVSPRRISPEFVRAGDAGRGSPRISPFDVAGSSGASGTTPVNSEEHILIPCDGCNRILAASDCMVHLVIKIDHHFNLDLITVDLLFSLLFFS